MKASDTLQLPGTLVERLRSVDLVTLQRSWQAMIVDEASDDLTLGNLALALQVVHDRLVGIEPARDKEPTRRKPSATYIGVVVRAVLDQFPELDESSMRARQGDRSLGVAARTMVATIARHHLSVAMIEPAMGWGGCFVSKAKVSHASRWMRDPMYARRYHAAMDAVAREAEA